MSEENKKAESATEEVKVEVVEKEGLVKRAKKAAKKVWSNKWVKGITITVGTVVGAYAIYSLLGSDKAAEVIEETTETITETAAEVQ